MLPETLIQQTVTRFPRFAKRAIEIQPLEKGGSDRKYYRVRVTDEHSLILVKYGHGREENRHYCAIAGFLAASGIAVPEIYFHDEEERLIWMQDLGELDLWSFREEPWPVRRDLYSMAIGEVAALHMRAHAVLPDSGLKLQAEFNADLYRWEQNYFFENCIGRFFKMEARACDSAILDRIAHRLAELPRVLVHRDFQSQNILIEDDRAWLIDFQGLRPGLPHYDLASLVYDPYVHLTSSEREWMIEAYISKCREEGYDVAPDFRQVLDLCAMQRLMQALGAYGFLGLVKMRDHFLKHIPVAVSSLREICSRIPELRDLPELLAGLRSDPA